LGFRVNIYLEVAKGFHESAGMFILTILITTVTVSIIGLLIFTTKPQKIVKEDINSPEKNIIKYKFIIILLLIFSTVFLNWLYFKSAYINDQITYYHQLYDTVAPFINEKEQLMIKSNFSQIKNIEDYDEIINHLKKIADENNQTYKEYTLLY
jgi:hypothetical protein